MRGGDVLRLKSGSFGHAVESLRFLYLRRVVFPALRVLGPGVVTGLAGRLARRVGEAHSVGRRRAEHRLAAALGSGCDRRRVADIIERMNVHQGRFWAEVPFLRGRLGERSWRRHVSVNDEATLGSLAESPRGCILTTGYFGNPAVCACALGHIFRPIHVVVDYVEQPVLRRWQRELCGAPHVRPIDRRDGGRALPGILSNGGAVLLIGEHERLRGRGVTLEFLGRSMTAYPTLGRLARWCDASVAVVTCARGDRPMSFELRHHATIEHGDGDDGDAVVRRALEVLEQAILEQPEQYLWSAPTRAEMAERLGVPARNFVAPRPRQWEDAAGLFSWPRRPCHMWPQQDATVIETENGSASCPRTCQTTSDWRSTSGEGRTRASSATEAEPVPRA